MEITKDASAKKVIVRCPCCDRVLMKAVMIVDGVMKCEHCNGRYIVNVKNGGVSVIPITQIQDSSKEAH